MKKSKIRLLSVSLILSMLFPFLPKQVYAQNRISVPIETQLVETESIKNVFPIYRDAVFNEISYNQNLLINEGKIFVPLDDIKNFSNYTWVEYQSSIRFKGLENKPHFRTIQLDIKDQMAFLGNEITKRYPIKIITDTEYGTMAELSPLLVLMNINATQNGPALLLTTPRLSYSHLVSKINSSDFDFNIFDEYGDGEKQTFLGNALARISWYASWHKQTTRSFDLERLIGGFSRNDYEKVFISLMTDASALSKARENEWLKNEIFESFSFPIPNEQDFLSQTLDGIKMGDTIKDYVDLAIKDNVFLLSTNPDGKDNKTRKIIFDTLMEDERLERIFSTPLKSKDPKEFAKALDNSSLDSAWKALNMVAGIAEEIYNQNSVISDQREMLDVLYSSGSKNRIKALMAKEVYDGFGKEIADKFIHRSLDKTLDILVDKITSIGIDAVAGKGFSLAISLGYDISDLAYSMIDSHAVEGVNALGKAPLFMDIAEDGRRTYKQSTGSGKADERTLNNSRLAALMMLLADRRGWETMYHLSSSKTGAQGLAKGYQNKMDTIDELVVALYAAKESLIGESSDNFQMRFTEMEKTIQDSITNLEMPAVSSTNNDTNPKSLTDKQLVEILQAHEWTLLGKYGSDPAQLHLFEDNNAVLIYPAVKFNSEATDFAEANYYLNPDTSMESKQYDVSNGILRIDYDWGQREYVYDELINSFRVIDRNQISLVPVPNGQKALEQMLAMKSYLQSAITDLGVVHFNLPRESYVESYYNVNLSYPEKNKFSGYTWTFISPDGDLLFILFTGNRKMINSTRDSQKPLLEYGINNSYISESKIDGSTIKGIGNAGDNGVFIALPSEKTVKTYSSESQNLFNKTKRIHEAVLFDEMDKARINLSLYYENLYPMGDMYSQSMADENEAYVNSKTWHFFEPSQMSSVPNTGLVMQFEKNKEAMSKGMVKIYLTTKNYSLDKMLPKEYELLNYEWITPSSFKVIKKADTFTNDGDRIFELIDQSNYTMLEGDYILQEIAEAGRFGYTLYND